MYLDELIRGQGECEGCNECAREVSFACATMKGSLPKYGVMALYRTIVGHSGVGIFPCLNLFYYMKVI